jgi:RNA polymerase sigma factor (sigma-70 family)
LIANEVHTSLHNQLVSRCRNGDQKAFQELYRLYSRAMYNVSLRILNDKAEAEDVLQESFVAAFRHIQSFDEKGTFGSWLKRIVINKSIDAFKKKQQNFVSLDNIDLQEEDAEETSVPDFDAAALNAAIELLPDGYRIILSLFLFEDYSHKMIAEKLGITESTSKSQYLRARKKLSAYLKQQMYHGRHT